MKLPFVFAFLVTFLWTDIANAQTLRDDWLLSGFVPCEGLGVNGATRAYVSIRGKNTADGFVIEAGSFYLSTAALQAGTVFFSASIAVVEGDSETQKTALASPLAATFESYKANETSRLYLPHASQVLAPPGGKVRVKAVAAVKLSGGNCSLGSGSHDIRLPHRKKGITG